MWHYTPETLENSEKVCKKPLSDQQGSPASSQIAIAAGYTKRKNRFGTNVTGTPKDNHQGL